jgi:hypothetical protein
MVAVTDGATLGLVVADVGATVVDEVDVLEVVVVVEVVVVGAVVVVVVVVLVVLVVVVVGVVNSAVAEAFAVTVTDCARMRRWASFTPAMFPLYRYTLPLGTSAWATAVRVAPPAAGAVSQICVPSGTSAPLAIGVVPEASPNMLAPVAATVAPAGSFVVTT